jgi:hypothetical protein
VSIWQGDADPTVKPVNAEALVQQWTNVHGIDAAPVQDKIDGYPRKVWRRDGVDVVESYTITGMAHGTPLSTAAHGGKAGPFLLETGISSSYHIARFFGLTGEARVREPARESVRTFMIPEEIDMIPDDRVEILDGKDDAHTSGGASHTGPVDVMGVITKALTQAGLMKPPV